MHRIVGNPVGVPNPQSDWNQTDPTKADYIKNIDGIKKFLNDVLQTGIFEINDSSDSSRGITIAFDGIYGKHAINIDLAGGEIKNCTWGDIEILRYLDETQPNKWVNVKEAIDGLKGDMGDIETALSGKAGLSELGTILDNIIAAEEMYLLPNGDEVGY